MAAGIYFGTKELDENPSVNAQLHREVDNAFETVTALRSLVLKDMPAGDIVDMLELNVSPEIFREVQ